MATAPKAPAPKKATRTRRRKGDPDHVGTIRVPSRFQDVAGDLEGIPLLKALYFLSEGERIGREGNIIVEQLRDIRLGVLALLEASKGTQDVVPPNAVPFPVKPKASASGTSGKEPAGATPGVTAEDAAEVRKYATAYAGGDPRMANMAYAKVLQDAEGAGQLNSRWQMMIETTIDDARERLSGAPQEPPPGRIADPLGLHDEAIEPDESEFDDGT